MKRYLFVLQLLLAVFAGRTAGAQATDSAILVNTSWEHVRIDKRISLKQHHFTGTLFHSNQSVSILEIRPGKPGKKNRPFFYMTYRNELTPTSVQARETEAKAAVNGTFFSFEKPVNSVDYLRIDSVRVCSNNYKGRNHRAMYQQGMVIIDGDGRLSLEKCPADDLQWEENFPARNLMCSGPILLVDGQREALRDIPFYTKRHPRSAVAVFPDGTVWILTVDGRHAEAQGMSLSELQNFGKWLGAEDLLNLDGGGSTTMYINPKLLKTRRARQISHTDGVINYPCDNHEFDHLGERRVANTLCIR